MEAQAMEAQAMEARARLARSDETAAGNRLEDVNEHPLPGMYNAPPSRFSDAELEEMMRAQGVDPREVEEYRFDVPTEFDLTPEEMRQYDPDDEMYNEEAEMERDFNFHVRGLGARGARATSPPPALG